MILQMSKLIKILLLVFIFLTIFSGSVSAQTKKILGVVSYVTHEDLLFLFQNTDRTLVYLDGESVEKPTFVGIFTGSQRDVIEKRNLKFNAVDENVTISKYVLLYNPIPDQGKKLDIFGEPNQFTKKFTLLKLHDGKEFTHEGAGGEFFEVPFLEGITPPPNATPVEPVLKVSQAPSEKPVGNANTFLIVIVFVLIIGAAVCTFLFLKKKNKPNQPQF